MSPLRLHGAELRPQTLAEYVFRLWDTHAQKMCNDGFIQLCVYIYIHTHAYILTYMHICMWLVRNYLKNKALIETWCKTEKRCETCVMLCTFSEVLANSILVIFSVFSHNSSPWRSQEVLLVQMFSSKRTRPPYTYQDPQLKCETLVFEPDCLLKTEKKNLTSIKCLAYLPPWTGGACYRIIQKDCVRVSGAYNPATVVRTSLKNIRLWKP